MKITILCSDNKHPIFDYLLKWIDLNKSNYDIKLFNSVESIQNGGDILFLISCTEIIEKKIREKFNFSLVLHASNLPLGRGFSPHIWDILNGSNELTLSLINAEDIVDTGAVWKKIKIPLNSLELYDEINEKLFKAELMLMDWACKNVYKKQPVAQENTHSTYYRKRVPEDSEINIYKNIESQFDLLRISDPNRYPAHFVINGQKFKIKLEKVYE